LAKYLQSKPKISPRRIFKDFKIWLGILKILTEQLLKFWTFVLPKERAFIFCSTVSLFEAEWKKGRARGQHAGAVLHRFTFF
jgi:hypothetical protein